MKIDPQLQSVLQSHFEKEMKEKDEHVIILSSYKLSEEEILKILDTFPLYKGKKVENAIEPDLIGGFIISQGSKLIDLSVKTILQTVQKTLYET